MKEFKNNRFRQALLEIEFFLENVAPDDEELFINVKTIYELIDKLDDFPSALDSFDRILMHKIDLLELAYRFYKDLGYTEICLGDIIDNDLSDTIITIDKVLDWSELK